ncbi:MAG: division/cell wall cluster transcriptional repressor MraZ [Solirubrobacterales bacterium]
MAFRGQQEHSLDSKDRITVPARFRASLAEGVVLSAGLDPCVDVYPLTAFAALEENYLSDLSPMTRDSRMLRRRFYSGSEEGELDSAGRIRLPKSLLEHASLAGQCVIVGAGDHLEIWGLETWAPERDEFEAKAAALAESLDGPAEEAEKS